MQRILALMCVVAGLALALACGSGHYQVLTHGGQSYTAVGEPQLDKQAQTYTFFNQRGEKVVLVQGQVKSIEPTY